MAPRQFPRATLHLYPAVRCHQLTSAFIGRPLGELTKAVIAGLSFRIGKIVFTKL